MRVFRLLALGAAALAASPASAGEGYWSSILADFFVGPARRSEFRWQGALASGRTLEIKGVNGAIRAEAAAGGEVDVLATRTGRRNDPAAVEIKIHEHARGITICALYPTPPGKPANECLPGDEGRMNVKNNDVNVDFVVKVPAGVHLTATTVNGAVNAEGLSGNVTGETVNGSVNIDTTGWALAETVNGSIRASMGKADWPGDARFETVNGSIRLDLPSGLSADLDAEVVNGSITTAFPVSGTTAGRRRLAGRIGGGGGRKLELETVNGSITLEESGR